MIIQGLGKTNQFEAKSRYSQSKLEKKEHNSALFSSSDTVEIGQDSTERAAILQKIKGRVKSGFYNSESVLEDLSHGFAKLLDQSI